jgi:thermopsin
MVRSALGTFGALLVVFVMVASSMAVLTAIVAQPVVPAATHGATAPGSAGATPTPTPSTAPSKNPVTVSAARAAGVAKARAAFLAAGGNLSDFFPPSINAPTYNPSGTGGHVVPLFDNTPAPMGIATYGLRNTSGTITPYVLNTKSVEGSFTTSDPLGVEDRAYDGGVGSQLNVIETNVTLKDSTANRGNTNQFWLQNTLEYTPGTASGSLSFDENIWNFSYNPQGNQPWAGYSAFPSGTSTILHGGGSVSGGELYEASGPSITVTPAYPITIQTYLNTTVACYPSYTPGCLSTSAAVDEVYMNYSVWNAAGQKVCPATNSGDKVCSTAPGPNTGGSYDNVYFNSADPTGVSPTTAQIQANGYQYASDGNGTNLDMELDFGIGDSDAEVAMGTYADAQLGLFTLNASTGHYQTVPSAYDFGSETGESTEGQYGTWSIGPNGAPVEQFRTGPSILAGLWNTSSSPGAYALNYANVNPQNAWVAVAPGVAQTNQEIFRVAPTFGWFNRPTSGGLLGPNMWLQPGIYTVEVMLSGYNTVVQTVDLTSSGYNLNINLVKNPASTTYTPLYAYSNSQLAAISTSGAGTSSSPYILWGNQPASASLSPLFGDMSQWPFQVWQGIEVNSTTAHATWEPLPSLSITYPWWEVQYLVTAPATGPLPLTNHLPIYLFDVQNVTIADSQNISAEYASAATGGYSILASGVKNVLIAGNHFNVSDEGLDFTGAGGNNTVWGNTFLPLTQSLNPATSGAEPTSTALADADSATATVGFDHIYDNAFYTNSSASTTAGIYWNVSCQVGYSPSSFFVGGGIPCQPLAYSQVVNGLTLTGSIVGSSYQGGNFWFNYGNEPNPYANLPFVDRASSLTGAARVGATAGVNDHGDYAPLIAFSLYKESFTETGLPAGTTWNVTVFNSAGYGYLNTTSTTTSTTLVFYFPNGAYTYGISSSISGTTRYAASPASTATGSFVISGANLSPIAITFATAFLANFTETGLATTRRWFINVTGQLPLSSLASTAHLGIGLVNGAYTYTVGTVSGYSTTSYSGGFTVASATVTTPLTWTAVTYGVTFTETGLPAATTWSVTVTPTGGTVTSNSTTHTYSLANGTYKYSVPEASGYAANPATGTFLVSGGTASIGVPFGLAYNASFTETGLPLASAGYEWIITIPGQPVVKSTSNPIVIALPDGTYNFGIGSQSTYSNAGGLNYTGYSPSPASGTLTVNNGPASQAITFSATLWNVPFIETGLPTGTSWEVTVYDGAGFISESSTSNTILFTLVNATYAYSIGNVSGYTTSHTGSFLLWGAPNTILVAFNPVYTLTFTESGLPGGTWNVTILHETLSAPVGSPIVFSFPNGTYHWVIGVFNGFSTSTPSGNATINGADASVAVTFTRVTYAVTFTESGLPGGTSWTVKVGAQTGTSTGTTITLPESNGSYSYVATVTGGTGGSPVPFSVSGAPVGVAVPFYKVTFVESGLPSGTSWNVTTNGMTESSVTTSIAFYLTNGPYSYAAAVAAGGTTPSGSFSVSSAALTVHIAFYKATFTESGLPAGTHWTVTTNGVSQTVTTTSMVFYEANGTYAYSVGLISGYHTVDHGTFVIAGNSLTVHSTFSRTTYTVKFTETGLTSGWHTTWCVTYNGSQVCTTASSIAFDGILNGTSYSYTIGHVANYSLDQSYTGSGTVPSGGGQGQIVLTVPVHFVLVKYTVTFTESGLPSHTSWQVTMSGKTTVSTGNKITFSESNGTYAFTIVSAGHSETSNPMSPLTVNGAAVPVAVTFT